MIFLFYARGWGRILASKYTPWPSIFVLELIFADRDQHLQETCTFPCELMTASHVKYTLKKMTDGSFLFNLIWDMVWLFDMKLVYKKIYSKVIGVLPCNNLGHSLLRPNSTSWSDLGEASENLKTFLLVPIRKGCPLEADRLLYSSHANPTDGIPTSNSVRITWKKAYDMAMKTLSLSPTTQASA